MSWLTYEKSTRMKKSLQSFQAGINLIYQLLLGKNSHMSYRSPSIFDASNAMRLSVPSSFECVSGALATTDIEFYVPIEASVKKFKSTKKGKQTHHEMCCNVVKHNLTETLRHMRDYEALLLTDEEMVITVYSIGSGILIFDPSERALYQFKFGVAIKNGLQVIHINIFGELSQGMNNPSSIFV